MYRNRTVYILISNTMRIHFCLFIMMYLLHFFRFNEENRLKIGPFDWLPFGYGPRNCIGMRLAILQSKIAIAHIVMKFKIVPCSRTKVKNLHISSNKMFQSIMHYYAHDKKNTPALDVIYCDFKLFKKISL